MRFGIVAAWVLARKGPIGIWFRILLPRLQHGPFKSVLAAGNLGIPANFLPRRHSQPTHNVVASKVGTPSRAHSRARTNSDHTGERFCTRQLANQAKQCVSLLSKIDLTINT